MRTRRSQEEPLVNLTNNELADLERTNNRAKRSNTSTSEMNLDNNNGVPPGPPFLNQVPPPPGGHAGAPPEIAAQYEARMQEQNNALLLLQQQVQQMMLQNNRPRARTIGEADNINDFYQNRSAIVVPPVPAGERRNIELRSSTITLVKQSAFHGLSNENPLRHIEQFEALCDTTQATGASLEFFRCKLFPFSLEGKAEQWLGSLPPGSLTSWRECKAAFLKHYYTKGKTAQLRSRISTFKQGNGESFTEAWGRFKEYIRECPHHGFQDEQLMRMFYDGVEWQYKVALNSASNGDFATQSSEGARELINNLASSLEEGNPEYDRTRKVNSISTPSLEEVAAQVQELLRMSGMQKEVHLVAEPETGYYQEPADAYVENSEEVSYVNGQGYGQNRVFNQGYRSHPNLSYRSTNVANPQDQVYPPAPQAQQQPPRQFVPSQNYQGQQNSGYQNQQMNGYQNNYVPQYQPRPFNNQGQNNQQNYVPRAPQQVQNMPPPTQQPRTTLEDIKALFFNGQMEITKAMKEVKDEISNTRTELQGKLDALETRVKMAETQVAQTAESMRRQPGSLPGRGENPRKDMCSVIKTTIQKEPIDCDIAQEIGAEYKVEKLGDPGPLNLQVEIKGKVFDDCLCDLGASVNLMPHTVAMGLGLCTFEPTNVSLRFADSSEKKPLGVVVDLPVKVDMVHVPTDFVVLELEDKSKETIILGRPFLNTTGAVINAREGSLKLDLRQKSRSLSEEKRTIDPGDTKSRSPQTLSEKKSTIDSKDAELRSPLGLSEEKRSIDPGDTTLRSPLADFNAAHPRALYGEAEWLKLRLDREATSGAHGREIHLEQNPSLEERMSSVSLSGSRSVTRPPDPPYS